MTTNREEAAVPGEPYETPAFQNAVAYTVVITYTVAGGARFGTADRRARRVAEQLANRAVGIRHVVEVTAVAGHSSDGAISGPSPVRFAAANSGHSTLGEPGKLDRWVDPDHERAVRTLAEHNAAAQARLSADRQRRTQVGCANAYRSIFEPGRALCGCVYCCPGDHLVAAAGRDRFDPPRCLCGAPVPLPRESCLTHRDVDLVVLDGDAPALQLVADEPTAGGSR